MPVSFRILPEHFLVYVHYEGVLRITDSSRALATCISLPDYRFGMRELIDLTDVTDMEPDYPGIMKHAALEASVHARADEPTLVVSLAPNERAQRIARIVTRAWEDCRALRAITVATEAEALAVLGVPSTCCATLLEGK